MVAQSPIPFVIAYDFDGTLSLGNMQEYNFVPALRMKSAKFWAEVKKVAQKQQADEILVYMYLMLEKARAQSVRVTRRDFASYGSDIKLFPGVDTWFERVNAYGSERGVEVQHFVISSGLREMIDGTPIRKHFTRVYASGFMYDHNGVACWPALALNYTTKTQYLFRINKGSLDVHDNSVINTYVKPSERAVPFSHMVFIGDGETDIPSMRLLKTQGGHSIAVYPKGRSKKALTARTRAHTLVEEGRATISAPAEYSEGSPVECAVKAMIDKVAAGHAITEAGD